MKHSLTKRLAVSILVLAPSVAPAQEQSQERAFYRVEAIVFTHSQGSPDAWPREQITDHSGALDPSWKAFARQQELNRAEDGAAYTNSELEATLNVVETLADLESGQASLAEALLYPKPWVSLETLSEPMAQAKARLEEAGGYRVHAWLAWHQPLDEDTPSRAVRIHDKRLISVEWIEFLPTGQPLRGGRPVTAVEALAPAFHYRLDGQIRLRQRQFMHADIDLEWRERATIGPLPWRIHTDEEASLETHRLRQSRTIRPERFEYFDSDWLGVLLRVTPWQRPAAESREADDDGETASP